ncbi:MAG: hypothetical protein ACK44E_10570, partial [Anaerolineales bacterium]
MRSDRDRELRFCGKYRIPSARLPGWDYTSAGWYFVTICVKNRVPCLAEIVNGVVRLSPIGEIVAEEWQRTAHIRPNVVLDAWVVMPDHFHAIIGITALPDDDDARRGKTATAPATTAPAPATTVTAPATTVTATTVETP